MSDAVDRKRHRTKRDRSFSLKKSTSQAYSDTKQKISKSMQDYWASLPMKPVTSTGSTENNNGINETNND